MAGKILAYFGLSDPRPDLGVCPPPHLLLLLLPLLQVLFTMILVLVVGIYVLVGIHSTTVPPVRDLSD